MGESTDCTAAQSSRVPNWPFYSCTLLCQAEQQMLMVWDAPDTHRHSWNSQRPIVVSQILKNQTQSEVYELQYQICAVASRVRFFLLTLDFTLKWTGQTSNSFPSYVMLKGTFLACSISFNIFIMPQIPTPPFCLNPFNLRISALIAYQSRGNKSISKFTVWTQMWKTFKCPYDIPLDSNPPFSVAVLKSCIHF